MMEEEQEEKGDVDIESILCSHNLEFTKQNPIQSKIYEF